MGWVEKVFGKRSEPPPPRALLMRWPGGTTVIDLSNAPLDSASFARVAAELSQLPPPRLRVWLFSTAELRKRSAHALKLQELLRGLHRASLGGDESGKRAPDVAVLEGGREGIAGAVYLLWSLAVAPFPLGDDGTVPVIEAKTALGEWVAGAHGEPLGEQPDKNVLRGLYLTRDRLEAKSDSDGEPARVVKLLDMATRELSFINSVLKNTA